LPQRLEYLTLAVANAKSSSSAHDGAMSVEFRTDLEEKLDVAQVQIEVCRSVFENPEMADDLRNELVRQLNERLLTISEVRSAALFTRAQRLASRLLEADYGLSAVQLYLDFAQPYELLESTLLILHTSDHRDPDLVSATWNAIIRNSTSSRLCRRILPLSKPLSLTAISCAVCDSSGEACVPVLAAKVADLGRRFYPSETAFPLEFLARRLEAFAWDQRAASSSAGWVPFSLRQAGVDWERIFDVFYATFEERVRLRFLLPRAPCRSLLTSRSRYLPFYKAEPWDSVEGARFLANDIGVLLSQWLVVPALRAPEATCML
jgi:nuclear pore complex protein Nup155